MVLKHAAVYVQDLEKAIDFYCRVLGAARYAVGDPDWAMVSWSDTSLSLLKAENTREERKTSGHPAHLGLCMASKETVDERLAIVKQHFPDAKPGTPQTHRDGSYGFYLHDPDRNPIEIIFIPFRPHTETLDARTASVWLFHGSRDAKWTETWEQWKTRIHAHRPTARVEIAYLEMSEPTLHGAVQKLVEASPCRRIQVVPMFLAPGGHSERDLPEQIRELTHEFPGVHIEQTAVVGTHPLVQEALLASAFERAWAFDATVENQSRTVRASS